MGNTKPSELKIADYSPRVTCGNAYGSSSSFVLDEALAYCVVLCQVLVASLHSGSSLTLVILSMVDTSFLCGTSS